MTSVLIMGQTEMMVVCAQAKRSSAMRLADLIASKGLDLKYVFLTHPHLDHSQGAGILLERFPSAEFIATPEVGKLQRHRIRLPRIYPPGSWHGSTHGYWIGAGERRTSSDDRWAERAREDARSERVNTGGIP